MRVGRRKRKNTLGLGNGGEGNQSLGVVEDGELVEG